MSIPVTWSVESGTVCGFASLMIRQVFGNVVVDEE